ncbi:MAG: hypothetical protein ACK4FF_10415 [Limnobacter sp.]|uniref:hypothetical protein n=1 Tax=Limnobacter sp. TaxID=2003368 RepID=UPI00391D8428
MNKTNKPTHLRLMLLGCIGMTLVILNVHQILESVWPDKGAEKVEASGHQVSTSSLPLGATLGRSKWEPSGLDLFNVPIPKTEVPPERMTTKSKPPPPPLLTAEVIPPPLPFSVLGLFKGESGNLLYLQEGGRSIPISQGTALGQGAYKVELISESKVSIKHLPTNHLYELNMSDLE